MKDWIIKSATRLAVVFLLAGIPQANAEWTGISVSIGEFDSGWIFENNLRNSETSRLDLQFEESTRSGLGVGAHIGQFTTRISNISSPFNTVKFDGSYFGAYIRYPIPVGEYISLQSRLGYQYHAGSEYFSGGTDQIEWREIDLELGLSGKFGNFRITSFAIYTDVSGDISGETGIEVFDSREDVSAGLSLDFFTEPTGYIRLRFISGEQNSAALSFAREF